MTLGKFSLGMYLGSTKKTNRAVSGLFRLMFYLESCPPELLVRLLGFLFAAPCKAFGLTVSFVSKHPPESLESDLSVLPLWPPLDEVTLRVVDIMSKLDWDVRLILVVFHI